MGKLKWSRSEVFHVLLVLTISFVVFRISSHITIAYIFKEGITAIYLPVAIGIFLIYRYGPIILIPMFINGVINGWEWGVQEKLAWPIVALTEMTSVYLSWILYIKILKGIPTIPNLNNLLKLLVFGISIPVLVLIIIGQTIILILEEPNLTNYISDIFQNFYGDFAGISAYTLFLLYYFFDFQLKPLNKINFRFTNIIRQKLHLGVREFFFLILAIISVTVILKLYFDFVHYWYFYGLLLLGFSLRYGFGISVISNIILINFLYIIPAMLSIDFFTGEFNIVQINNIFYGYIILSTFGLVMGRNVSDRKILIEREKKLANDLIQKNQFLDTTKAYFTRIFESSPNLIGVIRAIDGLVIDINEEGIKMLNIELYHSTDNTLNVLDFISSDAWTQIKHCQDLSTRQFEFEVKGQGKPAVLCEVTAREFTIDDEAHLLITATDISEKREAERQIERANLEKIELNKKIAEFRMMALRSAMSPHFIFNCLNSIQFFILKNNKKEAVHYLTIFSKLVRNVLNISTKSMVTLELELDIVRYYIALEQMRFDDKFEAVFDIDKTVDMEDTEIPPLLIQPYVENAILHGLSHKQGNGLLKIIIRDEGEYLKCVIEDNGVGREYTRIMKEKKPQVMTHRSKGMSMTQERLELLNSDEIEGVTITDLKDAQNKPVGTRVEIYISIE